MKLRMDEVKEGGCGRGRKLLGTYPAPKPYSVLDLNQTGSPTVTGCGESVWCAIVCDKVEEGGSVEWVIVCNKVKEGGSVKFVII
jgi:hypothetical protein